jgi:hypothetical protein
VKLKKLTSSVFKQSQAPVHTTTLEFIIPFVYLLAPILVENQLVMLCLVDRSPVEVEWQTPLVRFIVFYTLVRDWNVEKLE